MFVQVIIKSIKSVCLAATVIASAFLFAGCAPCDCGPGVTMNIKDLISSDAYRQSSGVPADRALDTLVFYLNLYPDFSNSLVSYMTGTTAYTLFAPSNAAFASLKATPGFPTNPDVLKRLNKQLLINVLANHFVEGMNLKADLRPGMVLNTKFINPLFPNSTQAITVNSDGTLKASPIASNTAIDIVVPDGLATNGVVHVIESLLIPTMASDFPPPYGKVAGIVLLNNDFSNLSKVLMAADLGFAENASTSTFKITTWLSMPISTASASTPNLKGITFFAPINSWGNTPVFTQAMADALIATPDKGRSFLLNHIVISVPGGFQTIGQYTVADPPATNPNGISKFSNLQQITPLSGAGKQITVSVAGASASSPFGVAVSNKVAPTANDSRSIVLKDLAAPNGYVHAIGGTLE